MKRTTSAVALLVGSVALYGYAQAPVPQRPGGTVAGGVTAVLVDVVVRDRRGEPVRDLKLSDFELIEDGVPQTIGSFAAVFQGTPPPVQAPLPTGPAPAPAADTRAAVVGSPVPVQAGPAVTALVFDRLTPEARGLAVKAAQSYIGSAQYAAGYVGVFGIDVGFASYAPFTRDTRVLGKGLATLESRASASFRNPEMQQRREAADRQAAMAGEAAANAQATGGAGASGAMGTAAGEAMLARMESRMIQGFEAMERDQQGYSTTNGLFAIINALRPLPGRKSLVLFSEGIAIPPAVERLFLGVIDAANRANVTIYTIDAAGLLAESSQAKTRDQVNATGRRGIDTGYAGDSSGEPLTKAMESNEDVLRQDARAGLGQLAQSTGGVAFDNTNDLRRGMDRIDADLRNYYLLGYAPLNDSYDGRFRTIAVKVNRPGLTVSARKGYFAVRGTDGMAVNSWEAPALGALERKPVPNAFPVRAGTMLFPEPDRPGLVPVVVDFKTAGLTFRPAADEKTYSSDFTVLVRFLDPQNQIARRVSQHYEINGPIAEIERAKQGDVLFYREPELAPGAYTMETVVHDAASGKASVRFSSVEVPEHDPSRLRISSLVLVKRADKVAAADRRPGNPLLVDDAVLYPNLGEPVSKVSREVGFYFAVYPVQGRGPAEGVLELALNGARAAQLPLSLAPPDSRGRIQQVGRLPIDGLTQGTYELRVVVKQGADQRVSSTLLRIVD